MQNSILYRILIIVMLVTLSSLALADQILVDSDLQNAMREAAPGDTLIVAERVWTEDENVWVREFQGHGNRDNPVTVMGAPGTTPILEAGLLLETDYWRIVNLHFRNGADIDFDKTDGVEVYDCTFTGPNYRAGAIKVGPENKNIRIENNFFEIANSSSRHHVVYLYAADSVVVRNNTIQGYGPDGLQGHGIHIYDDNTGEGLDFKAQGYVIENNIISGARNRAGIFIAYGGDGAEIHDIVVRNNVIIDCNKGIYVKENVFDVKVYNNTIFNMVGDNPRGIYLKYFENNIEIKNNIIYTNQGQHIQLSFPEEPVLDIENNLYYPVANLLGVTDANAIVADPMFFSVDSSTLDLRLQSDSPAVDKGLDMGLPFKGGAPDLGAFESDFTSHVEYAGNTNQPSTFQLYQNYPNPFNPETVITYDVGQPSRVAISVYDITGRSAVELIDNQHQPGTFTVTWDGRDAAGTPLSSGVYFYRIEVAVNDASTMMSTTRRMMLVR